MVSRWVLINKYSRSCFKALDHVQGQDVRRRESAAYTIVCEHFEPKHNAAIGHQMSFEAASIKISEINNFSSQINPSLDFIVPKLQYL